MPVVAVVEVVVAALTWLVLQLRLRVIAVAAAFALRHMMVAFIAGKSLCPFWSLCHLDS